MKNQRVVITRTGGPEVLELIEDEVQAPGSSEVRLKVLRAGVAFGDTYARRLGRGPGLPPLPFSPGYDVVGVVEELGADVTRLKVGMTVAGLLLPGLGGYSQYVCAPEEALVEVPPSVSPNEAVCAVLNYVTAHDLLSAAGLRSGDSLLVHGGGGGVGTAVLQLAQVDGIQAYATASAGKHDLVRQWGGHPIDYQKKDFVQELKALRPEGVHAVFDPLGGSHLARSLAATRKGGCVVSFGVASALQGGPRALLLSMLLILWLKLWPTGKRLLMYSVGRKDVAQYQATLRRIFALVEDGTLHPHVTEELPLREATRAHQMLDSHTLSGKLVLNPFD